MGKKCIPGLFCIDNMLLFILVVILVLLLYVVVSQQRQQQAITIVQSPSSRSRLDPLSDPYSPPLSAAGVYFPSDSGDVRGSILPIHMRTRGMDAQYEQVGILTREGGNGSAADNILPLMGKPAMSGRSKWQYYTMTSGSNMNTKLPIKVNGRDSTDEYGCDEVTNRDSVFVDGYNDNFKATVYKNNLFQYIPV